MLKNISLKNFKGFKDLENLKIKPITILCGTNSCGKSSILQSILLLKQTLESQDPNQVLLLNGRFVHLGAFENVIFEKNLDNGISFDFKFKLTKEDQRSVSRINAIPLRLSLLELFPGKTVPQNSEIFVCVRILLKASKNKGKNHTKTITVEQFQFDLEAITPDNDKISGASVDIKLVENSLYNIVWKNLRNRTNREGLNSEGEILSVKIKFISLFSIGLIANESDSEKNINFSGISFSIHMINNLLQSIFSSYSYIGPLREEPSRRYIYENEITEIGVKGENAAYLYLTDQAKSINNHYFYDQKSSSFKQKKEITLSAAVQDWLDFMNIKGFKSELINDIVYLNLNSSSTSKTRVSIADVGFGVSQIFPIILEGLRMSVRNTLLLEQPEIHLHPNLQMQLADYFIALAKSGKKVMVETHSDHIINRLVRRIVEDETGTLKNLIGIHFISATDSGSICEEVCIDENFGVTNWPVDFFDQAAMEQESIIKAGLRKRQLARINNK
jgi:predicted ATPase